MKKEEIEKTLALHELWLCGKGGKRADLSCEDLRGVNLCGTNLYGVNLRYADLSGADLCNVDLSGADLCNANLRGVNLRFANLYNADLSGANLQGANLYGSDLRNTDLQGTDLSGANLCGADLRGRLIDENTKLSPIVCPETGSFIAYKKASYYPNSVIVVLEVLADAKRSSAATKKCRCSKAKVLGFETLSGEEIKENINVYSNYDETFLYKKGEIVEVKDFDDNRWEECAAGIHFFMSKQEAIDY